MTAAERAQFLLDIAEAALRMVDADAQFDDGGPGVIRDIEQATVALHERLHGSDKAGSHE